MIYRLVFFISIFFIIGCIPTTKISSIVNQSQKVNSTEISSNATLDSIIKPYKMKMDSQMNDTLAYSEKLIKKKTPESELGNWVVDGMMWYVQSVLNEKADIAVCNYGGLRIKSLPQGYILRRHIYELMPFDNELVIIQLDSNELKNIIKKLVGRGGCPISKGFNLKISPSNTIIDWTLNEKKENHYLLILSDYLANGGDDLDFLISKEKKMLNVLLRDALIQYAEHQQNLKSAIDGRIIIEE